METSRNIGTYLRQELQIIFATILLIIASLILFLPVLLVLASRKFLAVFLPVIKLNVEKILTSSATIFGVDDIHSTPKVNVIIILQIAGQLTVEKVTQLFQTRVLERLDRSGSRYFYPELKCYIYPYLGFVFWKKDTEFSLSNHILYYVDETGSSNYQSKENATILNKVRESLVHRPWAPKKSPWELLLLELPGDSVTAANSRNKTALIFRAHHALADGIGLFSMLCQDLAGNPELREASTRVIPKSWAKSRNALTCLTLPFKLHYIFSRQMIICNDENSWKVPEEGLCRKVTSCVSTKFPMDQVKSIAKSNSANAASVLLAMISGALRSCIVRSGESVPKVLHAIMPIPAKINHAGNMRNYISYMYPTLAIGASTSVERLSICDFYFKQRKNSSDPIVNAVIHKLAGSTCRPVVKAFQKNVYATILLSNFPGPTRQLFFDDHPITDMNFSTATHGFGGISIAILSYSGNCTFTVTFDDAIPTHDADPAARVCEFLETEFLQLKQTITTEDTV